MELENNSINFFEEEILRSDVIQGPFSDFHRNWCLEDLVSQDKSISLSK